MSDQESMDAVMKKYGGMEVALTLTVQELVDIAAATLIGVSLVGTDGLPEAVVEFLKGIDNILVELETGLETGEEIVSL